MKNFRCFLIFCLLPLFLLLVTVGCRKAPSPGEIDRISSELTWLGAVKFNQGLPSVILEHDEFILYSDPARLRDIDSLPKADLILISHDDQDHFDRNTLNLLKKKGTVLITNRSVARNLEESWDPRFLYVVTPGDRVVSGPVSVEVVPMYREYNTRRHPERAGYTGFIVTLDGVRIYFSGSIGLMPELNSIKSIDIACLNVRGQRTPSPEERYLERTGGDSYTLDEDEALEVLRILKPAVFFPVYWTEYQTESIQEMTVRIPPEIRIKLEPPF